MSTTKRHPAVDAGDDRRRCRRPRSPAWCSTATSTPAPMRAGDRRSPTACRCMPPVPMLTPNYRADGRADPHQRADLRRLPRLRRAAGDDHAGDALRRAGRQARHGPAGLPLEERASQRLPKRSPASGWKPASASPPAWKRCEPHWQRALADAEAFNAADERVKRGVGVASCWYGCGNTSLPNPSTIKIGIAPDGDGRAAPGRGRYRPGVEHGHRADRRRRARPAARAHSG